MYKRYMFNLQLALEAIQTNVYRSLLTALGVIFGVAAVIAMMAVIKGTEQELLEQIKLVGVNNIVVTPIVKQSEGPVIEEAAEQANKYSPGLSLQDVNSISSVLPTVANISPEIIIETNFVRSGYRRSGKLVGVEPGFFEISNFQIEKGRMFNEQQLKWGEQVCIIGSRVASKFFSDEDPLGRYIKCGPIWLKVVGVLKNKGISDVAIANLGIRDFNLDVFAPIKTVLIRYKNRSLVTEGSIGGGGMIFFADEDDSDGSVVEKNYHQIDRLVVTVKETNVLVSTAQIIKRLLERRHNEVVDFEIVIPEEQLKQQQETKDTFNMMLGAIASISLLIGGIGIMNIMLASVLERIKEIGIRLSIGARKVDISQQFLFEAVLISVSGGVIGILLGILISTLLDRILDIQTIVSVMSVVLSFVVAAGVGLIFGIMPAKRAADQDPVVSLRHE
ncbi:MAG TPA: FtsX-like permease family protein [Flavobacteriales bacterium]|nr:FtsX-like permease family protein [Flavobacteriales bacterium]